ncbi:MAG TPA: exodeoxyribonuclease III [Methanomassiliicoccales archaeon]|nr:exodeoxyribonuclease III [Methanomassiliicoccales archaeon]HQM66417.1 exodeoxyribonuclease III [Methanomassiliicoccales archaeon]HRR66577.1 exodeoxyribonuclease III [Methanomassiliicoccales archaeon]
MDVRLLSWNVNGIRAAQRKGLADLLASDGADVVCLQETKAAPEQLPTELREVPGYRSYFASPKDRKGYSGVAMYTKVEPRRVVPGLGRERFDSEGRVLVAHFDAFVLFNIYFPNGKASPERLRYKMEFYEEVLEVAKATVDGGRHVVLCGDVNTAHREIDLARPRENERTSGFLPQERQWIDRFLAAGFVDTFRLFDPSPERYTWWDMKTRARERNVGWRIDYFFVDEGLRARCRSAFIMPEVTGSDHCPIGLELEV